MTLGIGPHSIVSIILDIILQSFPLAEVTFRGHSQSLTTAVIWYITHESLTAFSTVYVPLFCVVSYRAILVEKVSHNTR